MRIAWPRIARWLLLVTFIASLACQKEARPRDTRQLVGAWRSSVHFDAGAFAPLKDLEFLYVFNPGGTLTESSNYDALPPVAPAYGAWKRVGAAEFVATYEFFVTRPPQKLDELAAGGGWAPDGRGVFHERFHLAADGSSFDSTFRYAPLKADGSPAGDVVTGHSHGVRIVATPE